MKILVLVIVLALSATGCAVHRTVDIQIKGDNIKTPYGSGAAEISIKKSLTVLSGKRQEGDLKEVTKWNRPN